MTRKQRILLIASGVAVAGLAVYLLATDSGKKELKRLQKTGRATADTFKTLGKEVGKNLKDARKAERKRALKAYLEEAMAG